MRKSVFMLGQYVIPQFLLSRFAGWMANKRQAWLKNYLISDFIRRYGVDMSQAERENYKDYVNFNDFFTRSLKPTARPIAPEENVLVVPIDGCVSQLGHLEVNTILQAKGKSYSVDSLLGNTSVAKHFYAGAFATFYLSPKDYHRVHMPFDGKLIQTLYIPGRLFSVNTLASEQIPNLFARNERLVCIFETAIGKMAVILIGAMIVGSIETIWGLIERAAEPVSRSYSDDENIRLEKGAELGRFLLGSSVIILFEKDTVKWSESFAALTPVQMGQALAYVNI